MTTASAVKSPVNRHRSGVRWKTVVGTSMVSALIVFGAACGTEDSDEKASQAETPMATSTTKATTSTTSDVSDETESGALTIDDVWIRTGVTEGNTAIYMVIQGGDADDRLVNVTSDSDLAQTIEIHEVVVVDEDEAAEDMGNMGNHNGMGNMGNGMGNMGNGGGGMKMMRQIEGLDIPAGGEVRLQPGGYHVMLLGLVEDIHLGDEVTVTLHFESAGKVEVTAEAREM